MLNRIRWLHTLTFVCCNSDLNFHNGQTIITKIFKCTVFACLSLWNRYEPSPQVGDNFHSKKWLVVLLLPFILIDGTHAVKFKIVRCIFVFDLNIHFINCCAKIQHANSSLVYHVVVYYNENLGLCSCKSNCIFSYDELEYHETFLSIVKTRTSILLIYYSNIISLSMQLQYSLFSFLVICKPSARFTSRGPRGSSSVDPFYSSRKWWGPTSPPPTLNRGHVNPQKFEILTIFGFLVNNQKHMTITDVLVWVLVMCHCTKFCLTETSHLSIQYLICFHWLNKSRIYKYVPAVSELESSDFGTDFAFPWIRVGGWRRKAGRFSSGSLSSELSVEELIIPVRARFINRGLFSSSVVAATSPTKNTVSHWQLKVSSPCKATRWPSG